ncbi:hypothetical protein EVAR_100961_1 [Eumeta japonica]|uniref:Uncharacterized protein n=1 Tax=Eumeta variegata TaxID=151549 RepID=A0A4C2ABV2_EUMVA|nr:hypothetical protein EVAR_100961_1 [Eumeta japonica]
MVNYLGCPREPPPARDAALRRPRALSLRLTRRTAARPHSIPPTGKQNQTSAANDLNQLMSIISIIDTNELAIFSKKFRAAANPTEKLICLIEHASLVEAIKNNKF